MGGVRVRRCTPSFLTAPARSVFTYLLLLLLVTNGFLLGAAQAIHALFEQHRLELQQRGLNQEVAVGHLVGDAIGCALDRDAARAVGMWGKRIGTQVAAVKKNGKDPATAEGEAHGRALKTSNAAGRSKVKGLF